MLSNLMALFVPMTMAALNLSTPRGEQIIKIPAANSSQSEICVIPKKYPNAVYSPKDIKSEQELCSLNGTQPAALCPKMVSTNPAVEFYSVPEGMTASQVESKRCDVEGSKKLAKYKGSISCSYTPSLLAYYHISRILGNVVQVPPVVLRTMDLKEHREIAAKAAVAVPAKDSLLKQIWQGFSNHLNAGASSSKKDALFTSDFTQSYGALQQNPRNEEKYTEMFFSAKAPQTRAEAFGARSPIYALLKDSSSVKSLVGTQWTASNVQKLLQMQNVADMIVLDHMLSQQDRFGNVHYSNTFYYLDSSTGTPELKRNNKMDENEVRATNAVMVKHMMLKDNDCGVTKDNAAKKAGLLKRLSHISPSTYARLLRLNADMSTEATRTFFMDETMMTKADYSLVKENLSEIVQTLQKACKEGTLKLDLDMDAHFANKQINQSCG
ncbi:hypothetical protein [Bdellovibrio sp. HCB337]|uniref:hypothetical protein n=1 Tax=Bdellovibrio sp. HCB337 TaxID=3394358 RepID=UPI0039A625B4